MKNRNQLRLGSAKQLFGGLLFVSFSFLHKEFDIVVTVLNYSPIQKKKKMAIFAHFKLMIFLTKRNIKLKTDIILYK